MKPDFGLVAPPTRTPATEQSYAKRVASICDVADPLRCDPCRLRDGIADYLARETDYANSTRRQYRAALEFVLARCLSRNPDNAALGEAYALLQSERPANRAREKRTSARKTKSVAYGDYRKVLAAAAKGSSSDPVTTVLTAMVRFGPELGLRPIEWQSLRVLPGGDIDVVCAKNSNGRAVAASRALRGLHDYDRFMLAMAVTAVAAAVRRYGSWERLYEILRSRLRTIARRVGVRISFYTLRHVMAGRQKQSGTSRVALAALLGHASDRTASQHYARTAKGWPPGPPISAATKLLSLVRKTYREPFSHLALAYVT